MKKIRFIGFGFMLCMMVLLSVALSGVKTVVFASENATESRDVEKLSYELFGDVKVQSIEYLYNLNDSPDFIYVDFKNYGYAVYLQDTLELLEYSPKGSLPYADARARKYYSEPANYFNKNGELFVNAVSNEVLSLSRSESEMYAQQILELFSVT